MQPIFIDWSRSFLQTAADYLIQEFTKKNQLDMRHVVLVMSGSRARDRLEEILAEEAEKLADAGKIEPAWYPPEFLTLGTLPEKFYALQKPVANDLIQYLAWIHAIDKMQNENSESLAKVLPYPPERNDLGSRLALGKMFASIHRELAADTLNFATVAEICRQMNIESETQRWEVLAELQETYLRFLDSLNLWDVQTARIFAIQQQKQEEFQRIYQSLQENRTRFILLGLVDMKMAQKKILKKFEGFITPVVFV
jgi:hypothetical protein